MVAVAVGRLVAVGDGVLVAVGDGGTLVAVAVAVGRTSVTVTVADVRNSLAASADVFDIVAVGGAVDGEGLEVATFAVGEVVSGRKVFVEPKSLTLILCASWVEAANHMVFQGWATKTSRTNAVRKIQCFRISFSL